jgi:hypothetical protein
VLAYAGGGYAAGLASIAAVVAFLFDLPGFRLAWMLVPWLTPHMTLAQLTFAFGTTVFVLIASAFEEAGLATELGDAYRSYRREVPAVLACLRPPIRARGRNELTVQYRPSRSSGRTGALRDGPEAGSA